MLSTEREQPCRFSVPVCTSKRHLALWISSSILNPLTASCGSLRFTLFVFSLNSACCFFKSFLLSLSFSFYVRPLLVAALSVFVLYEI